MKFSYLGNVFSSGEGVQEAVMARIKCRWKKLKDIASVCVRTMSLKLRGETFISCLRSAFMLRCTVLGSKKR